MTSPDPRPPEEILQAITAPGAPFALTTRRVDGVDYPLFEAMPPHLGAYFEKCREHADLPFLIFEGERLSYGEVYDRACRLAHGLADGRGGGIAVKNGERVAIAMRNYPEWIIAFIAITSMGAVAVPLNGWWETEELDYALRDCEARVVIVDGARAKRLAPLIEPLGLDLIAVRGEGTDVPGVRQLETAMADDVSAMPDNGADSEDDAIIMYTSGSTGDPKGAVSSHRAVICAPMGWSCVLTVMQIKEGTFGQPPEPPHKALLTIPLFHTTGLHSVFLLSLPLARSIVLMRKWQAEEAVKLIEQERITQFSGVPTMSFELLNVPGIERYDLSSLTDISSGGAARPPEHVSRLKSAFPSAQPGTGYGLTETNALGSIIGREDYVERPASVGRALPPLVSIKIVDDYDAELDIGERGEILIKSSSNCRGYWNKPKETADAFVDGWLRTGDIGYLDEEGFLYIVDRKKDIIIRGGENISCLEVEGKIHEHPSVQEVSVFGQPDERLGEIVCAVIYRSHDLNEAQLTEFLTPHLAKFKIPERVTFVDAPLPRLGSGKIDKRGIKAAFRDGVGLPPS